MQNATAANNRRVAPAAKRADCGTCAITKKIPDYRIKFAMIAQSFSARYECSPATERTDAMRLRGCDGADD